MVQIQTNATNEPAVSRLEVRVNFGRQADGCTYTLHPRSAAAVSARYPGVHPTRRVFVGYDTNADFESVHGPIWKQVASMLTGVPWEELARTADVVLYDPVAEKVIRKVG